MKPLYTQEGLLQALQAIANGMSQRKAEREYGIPCSTLQARLNGILGKSQAHSHEQRLSPIQEERLVSWILAQESLGLSPTHTQVRLFAARVLNARGDLKPLGKRWMSGFLRRNPSLRTKKQLRIDSIRVNGATTPIIQKWFKQLAPPPILLLLSQKISGIWTKLV